MIAKELAAKLQQMVIIDLRKISVVKRSLCIPGPKSYHYVRKDTHIITRTRGPYAAAGTSNRSHQMKSATSSQISLLQVHSLALNTKPELQKC